MTDSQKEEQWRNGQIGPTNGEEILLGDNAIITRLNSLGAQLDEKDARISDLLAENAAGTRAVSQRAGLQAIIAEKDATITALQQERDRLAGWAEMMADHLSTVEGVVAFVRGAAPAEAIHKRGAVLLAVADRIEQAEAALADADAEIARLRG